MFVRRVVFALTVSVLASSFAAYRYVLPEPGFPQCVGVQLKPDTWNDATLNEVAKLGFKIVRRGIYWSAVEKEKGVYDFSKFDAQMKTCKDLGLTVIVCLFGNNNGLYEDPSNKAITTEAARQGYAAFAAAAAAHYADQPIVWEIWNEPNVQTFWRKGQHNSPEFAKEYSDLVNLTVPAMLKANPEAFVVAGSVSNYWEPSYQWTESCFKNGVLKSGIKGWSVHPYGVKTPEEFKVGHDRTKALLKQYGAPDLPIIDTERGFTAQKNDDITLEGWSGGDLSKVNDYQAWHIVRQYLVDQIEGIGFTSWYELKGNEGFSLYRDGKPAPALEAFQTMMKELDGYHFAQLVPAESARDRLAVFVNKDGAQKLVAWTTPVPGGSPDETKEHDVIVKLSPRPGDSLDELLTVNLRGQETKAAIGLGLHLTGAPQYVALAQDQHPVAAVSLGLATFPGRTGVSPVLKAEGANVSSGNGQDVRSTALPLTDATAPWKFIPNTGKGSVATGEANGKKVVNIDWDFTTSKAKSTPYVMTSVPVEIAEGATKFSFLVRTSVAQSLTFRFIDATGQTLQARVRAKGTKDWELMTVPMNRKLEHWDGANDGMIHFPVKTININVPKPAEALSGRTELADFAVETSGSATVGKATVGDAAKGGNTAKVGDAAPRRVKKDKPSTSAKAGKNLNTAPEAAELAEAKDLALFTADAGWNFIPNTGKGDITAADGLAKLNYDFSESKAQGVPYVLASVPVDIAAGSAILYKVRTSVAGQKLTMRITDATGQTLQFKTKLKGTGDWETVKFPLNKKIEHWDGENDGFTHYPVKSFCLSVPKSGDTLTGTLEFSEAVVK